MTLELYRTESVKARSAIAAHARVVLPPGYAANAALIAAVAAGLIVLLVHGRYSARDTVRGYVTTTEGNVEVYSPGDGIIRRLLVAEGDLVQKGDSLAIVDTTRTTGTPAATRKAIAASLHRERSALLRQIEHEKQSFDVRDRGLRNEIVALEQRQALLGESAMFLEEGLVVSQDELLRLRSLEVGGFTSVREQDRAHVAVIEQEFRIRELMLLADSARADIQQRQQALAELPAIRDARLAELNAATHRLSIRIAESDGHNPQHIVAPSGGLVSGLLVRSGQTVTINSPLLNLVPEDRKYSVELLIPAGTIGFVRPGAAVRIRYDAFPLQKFGIYSGVVANVARSTVLPGDKRFRIPVTDPVYLARVTLAGQRVTSQGESHSLRAGMTLTADILRDERRIVEWLFEPLVGAARRL
jgi:membrane fusion protein